jgi:hypothetical protein
MRTGIAGLLSTLVLLAAPGAAAAALSDARVGHVRAILDTGAAPTERTAERQGYVILQAWQTNRLRELKAANPAVRVLVYKNLSFSAQLPGSHVGPSPSGVWYSEAPDRWFLRNTSGRRFTSWSYSWLWAMDVGDPDYQARWASNVVSELVSEGWDGVFLDDANATMKYHYTPGSVAKYPSDAAYSAATRSALAAIAPKIRAAGKLAVPNFASWVEYPATYNDWLRFVDGALDEMFLKWGKRAGEGYRPEAQWSTQIAAAKHATAQGKAYMAFTQSAATDSAAARYGYASLLLATQGNASFALTPDYGTETWFPEYDYDLGRPLAGEERDPNGVHRRAFERGLVLVNPTGATRTVDLGGRYSGSGLDSATSATMPPQTGLILQSPGGTRGPGEPRNTPGAGRPASNPMSALATSSRASVALRWTRGSNRARRFRVLRNGRVLRVVRRRRAVDRTVQAGRVYRYRVVGLDRRGRVVSRSRRVVIRAGEAGSGRRLRVSLAVPARGRKRVRVEVGNGRGWRRVAARSTARRRMSFSLPRRRRAVRVVVTAGTRRVVVSRASA